MSAGRPPEVVVVVVVVVVVAVVVEYIIILIIIIVDPIEIAPAHFCPTVQLESLLFFKNRIFTL